MGSMGPILEGGNHRRGEGIWCFLGREHEWKKKEGDGRDGKALAISLNLGRSTRLSFYRSLVIMIQRDPKVEVCQTRGNPHNAGGTWSSSSALALLDAFPSTNPLDIHPLTLPPSRLTAKCEKPPIALSTSIPGFFGSFEAASFCFLFHPCVAPQPILSQTPVRLCPSPFHCNPCPPMISYPLSLLCN